MEAGSFYDGSHGRPRKKTSVPVYDTAPQQQCILVVSHCNFMCLSTTAIQYEYLHFLCRTASCSCISMERLLAKPGVSEKARASVEVTLA